MSESSLTTRDLESQINPKLAAAKEFVLVPPDVPPKVDVRGKDVERSPYSLYTKRQLVGALQRYDKVMSEGDAHLETLKTEVARLSGRLATVVGSFEQIAESNRNERAYLLQDLANAKEAARTLLDLALGEVYGPDHEEESEG